jgi:hypothetical protein
MARKPRTDRLTISGLSADDLAWLNAESDRLGIDPENLIRSLIRRRVTLYVVSSDDIPPAGGQGLTEPEFHDNATLGGSIVLDDASLDEVMASPPTLTAPAPARRPAQRIPRNEAPRRAVHAVAAPRVAGAFSAFSLVKPVGLSDRVARGPAQGDGIGNVMRQNSTWAGFSNGGSRR